MDGPRFRSGRGIWPLVAGSTGKRPDWQPWVGCRRLQEQFELLYGDYAFSFSPADSVFPNYLQILANGWSIQAKFLC